MERKKILAEAPFNIGVLFTSLEKASKSLLEEKEKLEKRGWSGLHLKPQYDYQGFELTVMGIRPETDEEYNKRQQEEEKTVNSQTEKRGKRA